MNIFDAWSQSYKNGPLLDTTGQKTKRQTKGHLFHGKMRLNFKNCEWPRETKNQKLLYGEFSEVPYRSL